MRQSALVATLLKCSFAACICATTRTATAAATDAGTAINDGLGLISNAFGAYQLGQFISGLAVGTLADNGNSAILSFIQQDRNDNLYGTVQGLMDTMETIKSAGSDPIVTPMLADWFLLADQAREQIAAVIRRGDPADARQLGLALNVLTILEANGYGTRGFASSNALKLFDQTFQTNFQMIGAEELDHRDTNNPEFYPRDLAEGSLWLDFGSQSYSVAPVETYYYMQCVPIAGLCLSATLAHPISDLRSFPPGTGPNMDAWRQAAAAEEADPVYKAILAANFHLLDAGASQTVTKCYGPRWLMRS